MDLSIGREMEEKSFLGISKTSNVLLFKHFISNFIHRYSLISLINTLFILSADERDQIENNLGPSGGFKNGKEEITTCYRIDLCRNFCNESHLLSFEKCVEMCCEM